MTAVAVDVQNYVTSDEADNSNNDVNHNDSTPRSKKSKGMHAGVALYQCNYNTIGLENFLSSLAVPVDPYNQLAIANCTYPRV